VATLADLPDWSNATATHSQAPQDAVANARQYTNRNGRRERAAVRR